MVFKTTTSMVTNTTTWISNDEVDLDLHDDVDLGSDIAHRDTAHRDTGNRATRPRGGGRSRTPPHAGHCRLGPKTLPT